MSSNKGSQGNPGAGHLTKKFARVEEILQIFKNLPQGCLEERDGNLQGVTPIDWDMGCAIFLGYFFSWKINFWVYFIACDKFLGQDFSPE